MLVIAGFVFGKRRWKGWKAFAPLLCGLALPVAIAAKIFGGQTALDVVFGILTFAGFFLLGRAVFVSASVEAAGGA
jgi:peptidoglycan/LPS O-acetylase OafA/YrhL